MLNLKLKCISLLFRSPSSQHTNQLLDTALHEVAQYQISHTLLPLLTDSTGSTHLLSTDSSISNPLTCPTAQKSEPANTADKAVADQRAETGLSAPAHPLPWLNSCTQPLT